ncbi:hypothetical protein AVEN_189855-2-1, partial [Araneus ventricosus]
LRLPCRSARGPLKNDRCNSYLGQSPNDPSLATPKTLPKEVRTVIGEGQLNTRHYHDHQKARALLLIYRLHIHVLVVPPVEESLSKTTSGVTSTLPKHPGKNDLHYSLDAEIGVLIAITGHGPIQPEGGTFHHRWRRRKDEPRSGRPPTSTTPDNIERVQWMLADDRRLSFRMIAEELKISLDSVSNIIHEHLQKRKKKVYAFPTDPATCDNGASSDTERSVC